MRRNGFAAAVVLLAFALGCSGNTEPETEDPTFGEVQYYGTTYQFGDAECLVEGTVGGEIKYVLSIKFTDDEGRRIVFSIQDEHNDSANLIALGDHSATGQHWDGVESAMQPAGFFANYLGEETLSVVWEEVNLVEHSFTGKGCIQLKERIEPACADSIWVGGHFAYPGDPEYDSYYEAYCEPGYFFPAQTIWFECENGRYNGES